MALVCFTFGCVIFSADETGWVLYASVCTIVLHMNVKIKRRLGESLALAYSEYLEIFTGTWKRQPSSWGTCSRTWESQDYSIQVLSSVLDKYLSSTWSVKYLNILPSTFYITGAKYLSKYLRPVHRLGCTMTVSSYLYCIHVRFNESSLLPDASTFTVHTPVWYDHDAYSL